MCSKTLKQEEVPIVVSMVILHIGKTSLKINPISTWKVNQLQKQLTYNKILTEEVFQEYKPIARQANIKLLDKW